MRQRLLYGIAILMLAVSVVYAQETIVIDEEESAETYDFTFRRVKVPEPNSTAPRIGIQIDPEEQARLLAIRPKPGLRRRPSEMPAPPTDGAAEWFWERISPALAEANPGRLQDALFLLNNLPEAESLPSPRLQHLQSLAIKHGRDILLATVGTDVSPALVLAVISVESGGRPAAESHAGAVGLMQLMPATAERFGVIERTDPTQNIKGGVAYLDFLVNTFNGDPLLVLAGYNAGENAVLSKNGVPAYDETRLYVPKVLEAWKVASALCLTPPMFISDGCVFAGLEVARTE